MQSAPHILFFSRSPASRDTYLHKHLPRQLIHQTPHLGLCLALPLPIRPSPLFHLILHLLLHCRRWVAFFLIPAGRAGASRRVIRVQSPGTRLCICRCTRGKGVVCKRVGVRWAGDGWRRGESG